MVELGVINILSHLILKALIAEPWQLRLINIVWLSAQPYQENVQNSKLC
jgi:hypothetical protein